jgi:glycerol-3-phosphate dehydrogenase
MAEDAMNKIMRSGILPLKNGSTENLRIHGYSPEEDKENRLSLYGSDKIQIQKLQMENEYYAQTLNNETSITVAQVIWAVSNEMARTVEDVLARRVRVLFTNSKLAVKLAPKVAGIMMKELNQNEEWENNQVETFMKLAKNYWL